jgi:hypothetical protein
LAVDPSVKGMRLKVSPNGRYFVDQDGKTFFYYPGAGQMGVLRRLFEQRPWYQLKPDQSVLASEPGGGPLRLVAARADDDRSVIAYLPEGEPVRIDMAKVSGKPVKAHWFYPREGTWLSIGDFGNTGVREFTAPSRGANNDWLLVLDTNGPDSPN